MAKESQKMTFENAKGITFTLAHMSFGFFFTHCRCQLKDVLNAAGKPCLDLSQGLNIRASDYPILG